MGRKMMNWPFTHALDRYLNTILIPIGRKWRAFTRCAHVFVILCVILQNFVGLVGVVRAAELDTAVVNSSVLKQAGTLRSYQQLIKATPTELGLEFKPTSFTPPTSVGFEIANNSDMLLNSVVAYDSINDRFLAVWSMPDMIYQGCPFLSICYHHVFAQLIEANGDLVGDQITLLDEDTHQGSTDMAYHFQLAFSPVSNRYLLAWGQNAAPISSIYDSMLLLDEDGNPVSEDPIAIRDEAIPIDIDYIEYQDLFAILHRKWDPEPYGVIDLIQPDGTITETYGVGYDALAMAYNSIDDEMLVAYDAGSNGIYVYRPSPWVNGDTPKLIVPYSIYNETEMVRLAYNDVRNEYLLLWGEELTYPSYIYPKHYFVQGVRLDSGGNPIPGSEVGLAVTDEVAPLSDLAASAGSDRYFAGWGYGGQRVTGDNLIAGPQINIAGNPRIAAVPDPGTKAPFMIVWSELLGETYYVRGLSIADATADQVPERSTFSCACSTSDPRECPISTLNQTQGQFGKCSNSLSGNFSYAAPSIGFDTVAGPLLFQPSYASQATTTYTDTLGVGWTHNQDTRLIFPDDPGGEAGIIWFKAHSANQYPFIIEDEGQGIYSPTPGVLASLIRSPSTPYVYTVTASTQDRYIFNDSHQVTDWINPQGLGFSYQYTGGQLSRIYDPGGARYLNFAYSGGQLETVSDHTGRELTLDYNQDGQLAGVTDVDEEPWAFEYEDAGNPYLLTTVVDPLTHDVVAVTYDAQERVWQQYDADNELLLGVTYNLSGTTVIEDRYGYTETHLYDGRNTWVGSINALGEFTGKGYDYNFRPVRNTDSEGNDTHLVWSADGANLERVFDAGRNKTELAYDGLNNLTSMTDPRENTSTYEYDGKLLRYAHAAIQGVTTEYIYTDASDYPQPPGLLKEVIDPLERSTYYTYDTNGQLILITDALLQETAYTYDALGRVETATYPGASGEDRIDWTCYDQAGRVVRTVLNVSNPQGDPCDAGYVPSTDPDVDLITANIYDEAGNLSASIDPAGHITRNYYSSNNRLEYTVQNLDPSWGIGTASPPPLAQRTSETNITTRTFYDILGNAIGTQQWVIYGGEVITHTTRMYYDELNRPEFVVRNLDPAYDFWDPDPPAENARGNDLNITTQMIYDEVGNAIKQRAWLVQDSNVISVTTRTYFDELNRPVTVVQNLVDEALWEAAPPPRGQYPADQNVRTDTYYDASGNVIATEDPLGVLVRTYYDELNRPEYMVQNLDPSYGISTADPPDYDADTPDLNIRTDTIYDEAGNAIVSKVWLAEQGTEITRLTRTYYDQLNRTEYIVRNLDPAYDIWDPDPPPYTTNNPDQNLRTNLLYDEAGNAIATTVWVVEAEEVVTRTNRTYYDELNRPVTAVQNLQGQAVWELEPPARDPWAPPDQNVRTDTVYDVQGNRINVTDPNEIDTRFEYDGLSRLAAVVENYVESGPVDQETNVRTEYAYDSASNMRLIQDANSHETTFTYDAHGRQTSESDPLGHTWESSYDALGNRVWTEDANTAEITYDYNALSQLAGIDYPTGTADVTFAYDAAGRRTGMTDGTGDTTWVYNNLGRVESITTDAFGTVAYEYDTLGNRITLTYPDFQEVSYAYDPLGRIEKVTDWDSQVVTYTYDTLGNVLKITRPNQVFSQYGYDALGRVLNIDHLGNGETLAGFDYTYDPAGNRVQVVETHSDLIFADGFESGDFSAWTYHTDDPDLTVTVTAALTGSYGMSAYVDDTTVLLAKDESPAGEASYRARFYFDASQVNMSNGAQFWLFAAHSSSTAVIKIHYKRSGNTYYLQPYVRQDNGTWTGGNLYAVSLGDPHAVEIHWKAATGAGANNGQLKMWVDGNLKFSRTNVDNDTHGIDSARIQAKGQVGYTGTYCFDAFESRRENYIGLDTSVESCSSKSLLGGPGDGGAPLAPTPAPTDTITTTGNAPISPTLTITGTLAPTATAIITDFLFTLSPTESAPATGGLGLLAAATTAITITYDYDPLYRLTDADYSSGEYFYYTYDAVGNRLTQTTLAGTNTYEYDNANRLIEIDRVALTWDDNGNLLEDETGTTFAYDHANRLSEVHQGLEPTRLFVYNGLGDRVQQKVESGPGYITIVYTLDLAAGLTQVLADGTNTYLYGQGRIGEEQPEGWVYHLPDALGSVRQLADAAGGVVLSQSYEPFGSVLGSEGDDSSTYGFVGEMLDPTGLIYLRARYYAPEQSRFISRDTWTGALDHPLSLNMWIYSLNNPLNYIDPTGHLPIPFPPVIDLAIYIGTKLFGDPLRYQGLLVVIDNKVSITSSANSNRIPPIIVAAAIMNQGNAVTRAFGDFPEMIQVNLPCNSKWLGDRASAGIGQLTRKEINYYIPSCGSSCLFDPDTAIEGMARKIAAADHLLAANIDTTDRYMILALAQNNFGDISALKFMETGIWLAVHDLRPGNWNQLMRILENIRWLTQLGVFELPREIDLNRWEDIYEVNKGVH